MVRRESRPRIVGIDWLELFVSEEYGYDYSPGAFRLRGYDVSERDYGTKTMEQMFTILDKRGYPFIEIRRLPRGLDNGSKHMVYSQGDAYVRLSNLYCYDPDPVSLITDFCQREKYTIKKIYRIDVYTDFEIFDTGDIPAKVVRRIVNHTYSKVNQSQRRTSGQDTWTECFDNWVSWGKSGSMVSTKIYDKTKELRDTGMHKPYIAETWRREGYIDNITTLSLNNNPVQMWRLEFSIKGSAKAWIYVDKEDSEDGEQHWLEHSLQLYSTKQGIINAIANLVPYYFHFKIYEEGKRKSLCQDKVLFIFDKNEYEPGYRLTNVSDAGRIRPVKVTDDVVAQHHLLLAWNKLYGTEFEPKLQSLITELQSRIDRKSHDQFGPDVSVF